MAHPPSLVFNFKKKEQKNKKGGKREERQIKRRNSKRTTRGERGQDKVLQEDDRL